MEVVNDSRRILLLSSSTIFGSEYLDHAEDEIRDFLGKITGVLFVPFALRDRDDYAAKARERFARLGYQLDSLHEASDMHAGLKTAEAIFVGGGNTFRLLKTLYDFDLLKAIRARVESGTPYIGSSAGSNVAGPTIKTTNDMPIVEPPSFAALGLVAFQINPHYVDPEPESTHMGETREERILQFLEENETPVIGLREGAMVRFENGRAELKGVSGARIFRKSRQSIEVELGTEIEALLEGRKFR
jgi:dipeptidase E